MRLRQIGEDLEKIKIVNSWLFRARSDVSLFEEHSYMMMMVGREGREGRGRREGAYIIDGQMIEL
jgi:hypothetical protein